MKDITRLAIVDRGEPVVRVLSAVGNINRRAQHPVTTIVVTEQSRERAWYAREADEIVTPPPAPAGTDPYAGLSPETVANAVIETGADTVWLGHTPCLDRVDLVRRLGYTLTPPAMAAMAQAPTAALTATLWALSRVKTVQELGAVGPGEPRSLLDAMVAAAPDHSAALRAIRP